MRIAVFGTGAVGGYFGGRLAAAGEDVTFIARGAHLAALQEQGLRITSPKGNLAIPVKATNDSASIGPVDVVLLTVKLYDVDAAIPSLAPLIGPDTVIITLQNGVEAVDMVGKHVGADHVAGGVAYIVAVVDEPGHIRHTVADRLVFGEADGRAVAAAAGVPGGGPPCRIRRRPDAGHRHRAVGEVRAAGHLERHDVGDALVDGDDPRASRTARDDGRGARRSDGRGPRARHHVPRRTGRRHPGDGAQLPARVEVVDARGPRARPSPGAAVAERRHRPHGPRSRACRRRRTGSSTRSCCRS